MLYQTSNGNVQTQLINGLRQGEALSCIPFNNALEKVIRDNNIQYFISFLKW